MCIDPLVSDLVAAQSYQQLYIIYKYKVDQSSCYMA